MERIRLSYYDEDNNEEITISFDGDGTIEQQIAHFRSFLIAQTFNEDTVDKFILDIYSDYSLLNMEERMNMKLKIDLPSKA